MKHNDNITQKVSRRGTENPLTILPEENLGEVTSKLSQEELLAARLIFRTANTDIFRLKWQDVKRKEEGWSIETNDREILIDEEEIVDEIDRRKQDNLPLLNTTKKELGDNLPEHINLNHIQYGGLAYLLEEKNLIEAHQRSGYASHTLDKYAKIFRREEVIQIDGSVYQEEMNALSRHLKGEKDELALLSYDEVGEAVLPESSLDQLCSKFHRKNYDFATRLIFRGGLRTGEAISNLDWEDIERNDDELEVEVHGRTTRTVTVEGEKLLNLYEDLQEDSGQVFDFSFRKYGLALRKASEGDLTAYRLRVSRLHHLINEEDASAEKLREELGFSLPAAENRIQRVTQ